MLLRWIVVGLGNPGIQFQNTPHNLGFEVVNLLATEKGAHWRLEDSDALVTEIRIAESEMILAKPQTLMNLSGRSVVSLLEKFGLFARDLIVTCDDLALPFGKIRVRGHGRSGGHKGLESIIEELDSNEFIRVRLGIGPGNEPFDAATYVLQPIASELRDQAIQMTTQGKEAVKTICFSGLHTAMNQFN
jgi:peptidyl-tRNA hydrolase, PTH1 family